MSSILEKSVLFKHVANLHTFSKTPKPIKYIRPVIQDDFITMEMDQKFIIPDDVSLSAKYNEQDSAFMSSVHNINTEHLIKQQLVDTFIQKTEEKVYQTIHHLSTNQLVDEYTRWDKFKYHKLNPFLNRLSSKINLPTEKEIRVKSTKNHELVKHIVRESSKVDANVRVYKTNFIICSKRMANYIMESTYTVFDMNTLNSDDVTKCYVEGTLLNMTIIINPYLKWNDKSIIIGAHNTKRNTGVNVVTLDDENVEFSYFRNMTNAVNVGVEKNISLLTKVKTEFIGNESNPPYRKINIDIKD